MSIVHFGIKIQEKETNNISREVYLSAKPEHMQGWSEESYPRQRQKAAINYDANMRFFEQLDKSDFSTHLNHICQKHGLSECLNLNELSNVSGLYIMVLDEYKQVYIGVSSDIKKRIQKHWNTKKSLERLIFGDISSSVLSIDSFGALDTTRVFYVELDENEMYTYEGKIVSEIDGIYLLNRTDGGIGAPNDPFSFSSLAKLQVLAGKKRRDLTPFIDVSELNNI